MKSHILFPSNITLHIFFIIVFANNFVNAQDIFNPYRSYDQQPIKSPLPLSPDILGYIGEYMISNDKMPWAGGVQSYKVETVSFPFMMQCWQTGCADGSTTTRILGMPQNLNTWDGLTKKYNGQFTQFSGSMSEPNDIVSVTFLNSLSLPPLLTRPYYPHTILKFTIYLHCGSNTAAPIADSLSWLY